MEILSKFIPNSIMLNTLKSWVRDGVREERGKNRGWVVDAIHNLCKDDPANASAWCMQAVIASCIIAGWATGTKLDPRISQSGSVHRQWLRTYAEAPELCVWAKNVSDPETQLKPGMVMIRYELVDPSKGHVEGNAKNGHTEVISRVYPDGAFDTIGGNTNISNSREGDGVYEKIRSYSLADTRVIGFWTPKFVPL